VKLYSYKVMVVRASPMEEPKEKRKKKKAI
jgi:hypothetical protein